MSVIHLNQIKNQVSATFDQFIDRSDFNFVNQEASEAAFLSRSLAAYAVLYLSGTTPEAAANSITDGGDDNGIDAVYYDEANKKLYLVQSKWIQSGRGEPSNGDISRNLWVEFVIFSISSMNVSIIKFRPKQT